MSNLKKIDFTIFYIDLVCKHGVAPRKTAVACNSHHRQGISLSLQQKRGLFLYDSLIWIYFVVVTQKQPIAVWLSVVFLLAGAEEARTHVLATRARGEVYGFERITQKMTALSRQVNSQFAPSGQI